MRLGRKPRGFNPRIPKLSRMLRKPAAVAVPAAVNYTAGMPASLGMMGNDQLGDCVEAALGHSLQVWSANAGTEMVTPTDAQIIAYYSLAGGYVPGNPSTDNGTVIQEALADWLAHPLDGNMLAGFVELDNLSDLDTVKRTIWEAGLVYIGFNVPAYLMSNLSAPGSLWDVNPAADNTIIGGHCVIVAGYDASGNMDVISWGANYKMTPAFWSKFVDEAYLLVNADWIKSTGDTPAGLSMPQLVSLMQEINTVTQLVPVVFTVNKQSAPLPAANAAQASTSVVVTDSSGIPQPPVTLTGTETPPWSFKASINSGAGKVVATDLDVNGATISSVSSDFSVTPQATFQQSTAITVTLDTSSLHAAAAHVAAARKA